MHATRLIAVSLLVVLGLAACGSSSKGASGSNNSSTTAPSSGSTSGSSGTPTTQKVSGDSNSNFCQQVRSSQNAFKTVDPTANAASLKTEFENIGPDLQKAESAAPSEIKPDFQTFINAYQPYLDALKAANYDFTKINFASLKNLDSAPVKAAIAHLTAYFTQVCHVTEPTTPTVSIP